MDSFVRRLVERLLAEGRPLSRNRHFHTFDTPEGRTALRTARRLRALHKDVERCRAEGGTVRLLLHPGHGEARALELCIAHKVGTHRAYLSLAEVQLLREAPGLAEAVDALDTRDGTRRVG
jgi:hypothetical protein